MASPDDAVPSASAILKKNKDKIARDSHSEIERRRRNKMNHYMRELSAIIPGILTQKKVDKLTILKNTVQYIRLLRDISDPPTVVDNSAGGNGVTRLPHPHTSADRNISFLTSREFRQVLMESANGFMFVYSSVTNKILYVGDVVGIILEHSKEMLEGRNIYDYIHYDDHFKMNSNLLKMSDQLDSTCILGNSIEINSTESSSSAQDYFPRFDITLRVECGNCDNFFGLESIYPAALCSNVKNFCRSQRFQDGNQAQILKDYLLVHCCTSLMKFKDIGLNMAQSPHLYDGETPNTLCVVAIGYIPPNNIVSTSSQFNFDDSLYHPSDSKLIFQLDVNGRILYIQKTKDKQWVEKLGSLDELHNTFVLSLIHDSDREVFISSFKKVIENHKKVQKLTVIVRFKMSGSRFIKSFITFDVITNAFNDNIECVLMECDDLVEENSAPNFEPSYFGQPQKRSVNQPGTPSNNVCHNNLLPYTLNKTSNLTRFPTPVVSNAGPEFHLQPQVQNIPLVNNQHFSQSTPTSVNTGCNINQMAQSNSQHLSKSIDLTLPNGHINSNANMKNSTDRFSNISENFSAPSNPLSYIWNAFNASDSTNHGNQPIISSFMHGNNDFNVGMANDSNVLNFTETSAMQDQLKVLQSNHQMINNVDISDLAPHLDNPSINYVPAVPNQTSSAIHYLKQYYNVNNTDSNKNFPNGEMPTFFNVGYNPLYGNHHNPNL